ncbi:tyrosine-type recombinase/integrase [Streptomyces erythrochromogenes]|uniref:tyrosine-type recombinase/integrase n=1 Tax=Streptomyces erythrochromogenes TaxID=285574 RepID=UPI002258F3DD|nr:site-specific integrase [Streptomyces erythrochromogenes]MCX5582109.1 site-specific integrase [Streptomyces erythrochromogenes]
MAGHIQDRWFKTETRPDGKARRVKSDRHGTGMRYRARYVSPSGAEKSRSFPDKQRRLAEAWLTQIAADMSRGQYVDPTAGKVTFQDYAKTWLASQTTEMSTIDAIDQRFRLHIFPHIGHRPLSAFLPAHIRAWGRLLQDAGLAPSYQRVIFANVSAVFGAAVDDGIIHRNPCRAASVRPPRRDVRRLKPWPSERVLAVRAALPVPYRKTVDIGGGCGLRQGEIFGLAVDEIDFLGGVVHVVRQVKMVRAKLVFAPPKGGKVRDVPLPDSVAFELAEHITQQPPLAVTLPWKTPDGPLVTASLIFYSRERKAVNRNFFNMRVWKPALVAAGVIPPREPGERFTQSREHGMHALRHFYASVLLDAGENVKALSEYLGHSDPGFTLRTYTHLMPNSQARARRAVDGVFRGGGDTGDGPQTAQEDEKAS